MRLDRERPEDSWPVEVLFDTVFGPGRHALSSYRLRDQGEPVAGLARILKDDYGSVVGAVRFWPVLVGGAETLLLGPIAVHPIHQGEGWGALLIEESLAAATKAGWARVLLVGDAPYYGRFGFLKLSEVEMPPPTNPERVLGRALVRGAWDGVRGAVEPALSRA
ncbi:MAG: N-acetyltransferase [Pseudomonadota bacterium]